MTRTTTINRNIDRRQFLKMASVAAAAPVALAATGWRPAHAAPSQDANVTGIANDASREFRGVAEDVMKVMKAASIPGVSLGVYANGRAEFAYLGVSHLKNGTPVSAATRFQMGSISKTFVATATMRLVEEGLIDLHAPLRSYLPDLRLADENTARRITPWHLLNHTSGIWGDYGGDLSQAGDDVLERFVVEVLPTLPVMFPLGEYVSYSNAALAVMGRVIEVVTGQTFRAAMQRLVLDPLALDDTTMDSSVVAQGSYAHGYGRYADGRVDEVTPLFLPRIIEAPGGLWTNAIDLLGYGKFQLGIGPVAESGAVISRQTQLAMQTPQVVVTGLKGIKDGSVGQSWFVYDEGSLRFVEHQGSTVAHQAGLRLVPSRNMVIAVLTNADNGAAAVEEAFNSVSRHYLGVETTNLSGIDLTPKERTPKQLAEYAGVYSVPSEEMRFRMSGGRLVGSKHVTDLPGDWHASNEQNDDSEAPINFIGDDAALVGPVDSPFALLKFIRRPDGSIGWVASGVRMLPRKA